MLLKTELLWIYRKSGFTRSFSPVQVFVHPVKYIQSYLFVYISEQLLISRTTQQFPSGIVFTNFLSVNTEILQNNLKI